VEDFCLLVCSSFSGWSLFWLTSLILVPKILAYLSPVIMSLAFGDLSFLLFSSSPPNSPKLHFDTAALKALPSTLPALLISPPITEPTNLFTKSVSEIEPLTFNSHL